MADFLEDGSDDFDAFLKWKSLQTHIFAIGD